MNYTELSAQIQAFTENTFPDAFLASGGTVSSAEQIARFVELAEQRIYNSVQFPSLRRNVTGYTTLGNQYLACPNDMLSVYSMAVIDALGNYEFLLNKDVNFIRAAYPTPTDTGLPKYYALFGPQYTLKTELSFILGPTPNANYDVELHYFFYPESITTAGTSWLGDNYDPVLLYGALREAYIYMRGEADMIANIEAKYQEALGQAKRLGDGMERGDAYRDGQFKMKVV
jgi:hypothetical protein